MTSQVADDPEAIVEHLLEMSRVAGRLRKLCPNGTIKIDDLEIASLTASLPLTFSSVLSQFERQDSARPKDAANAVRDELVTRKNQSNITVMANAVANRVQSKPQYNSNSEKKDGKGKERPARSKCEYCKNFHGGKCHKKEVDELEKKIEELKTNKVGKSQMAVEDSEGTNSDYSETIARSASNFSHVKPGRWNVDSGTTNCLVPIHHPVSNSTASSLTIRTANNEVMKASNKGHAQSPIPGMSSLRVHAIDGLVKPLLSVSDVTDSDVGVVFLQD